MVDPNGRADYFNTGGYPASTTNNTALKLTLDEKASAEYVNKDATFRSEQAKWGNGLNVANGVANLIDGTWSKKIGHDLMLSAMDNQMKLATMDFEWRGKLVEVQDRLVSSNEKVALQSLKTTERLAELQKEERIAVAQTRASAAVKMNRDNALSAQFYGQPQWS